MQQCGGRRGTECTKGSVKEVDSKMEGYKQYGWAPWSGRLGVDGGSDRLAGVEEPEIDALDD